MLGFTEDVEIEDRRVEVPRRRGVRATVGLESVGAGVTGLMERFDDDGPVLVDTVEERTTGRIRLRITPV